MKRLPSTLKYRTDILNLAQSFISPDEKSRTCLRNRKKFDFALTAIFLVGLITIVSFRLLWDDSKVDLQGSPYEAAFLERKNIIWAVVCTLSVTMTIGLETALDFFLETSNILKFDLAQRFVMFLIPVIPGIILLVKEESKKLPCVFAFCYTAQCIGCPVPLFSLCHQLFPVYFGEIKMIACYGFWAGSCILTLLVFLDPTQFWAYPCCLLFFVLSVSILGWVAATWFVSLYAELKGRAKELALQVILKNLKSTESSCLLYLACHVLTVILVPFIVGLRHNFEWVQLLKSDILAMIYSITMFSVLPSCIPGRIARNALKEKEQSLRTIRTLVRYVSHEIRTPLNIALSGLALAIHRLPINRTGRRLSSSLDPLLDASYACKAATKIIDDLSSMESIGSGIFYTNLGDQDASCLIDMAEQCRNLTEEKNITFTINDVSDCEGKVFCHIDPPQIKQVLQNIVGASTRFVPNGGFLTVEVDFRKNPLTPPLIKKSTPRLTKTSSTSRNSNQFFLSNKSFLKKMSSVLQRQSSVIFPSQTNRIKKAYSAGGGFFEQRISGKVVIKVSGNGIEASRQKFDEVFSEFSFFDADALQGERGCGLGLWISKEIMKRHAGKISFALSEPNQGTFCIELDGYNLLDAKNSLRKSIHEFVQSVSRKISQVSERSTSCRSRHSYYKSEPDILVIHESSSNPEPMLTSLPDTLPANTKFVSSFEQTDPSELHCVSERSSNTSPQRRSQKTRPVLILQEEQLNKTHQRDFHPVRRISRTLSETRAPKHSYLSTPPGRSILHKSFVREKEDSTPHRQLRIQLHNDRDSFSDDEDRNVLTMTSTPVAVQEEPSLYQDLTIRILVVDDVAMNRKMVCQMLRLSQKKHFPNLCLDICEADDGTSALTQMSDAFAPFDVVLMDNIMDNLCGPQAAMQMRQQGFKGKIIGVTGNVLKKDIDDFVFHGANYVLCKPVGVGDFEKVLRSWINESC